MPKKVEVGAWIATIDPRTNDLAAGYVTAVSDEGYTLALCLDGYLVYETIRKG